MGSRRIYYCLYWDTPLIVGSNDAAKVSQDAATKGGGRLPGSSFGSTSTILVYMANPIAVSQMLLVTGILTLTVGYWW